MAPQSQCSYCGARVGVAPGSPAPRHQAQGSRGTCPGSGQPTS